MGNLDSFKSLLQINEDLLSQKFWPGLIKNLSSWSGLIGVSNRRFQLFLSIRQNYEISEFTGYILTEFNNDVVDK